MKSLKESLFDSETQTMESLFDSDIVSKDLTFEDFYKFTKCYFSGSSGGYYAYDVFRVDKLKQDFGKIPYYRDLHINNNFIEYKDKQTRNRLFITNILLYLINQFDMLYKSSTPHPYRFYYDDKEVNDILSRVCTYLYRTLFKYRMGNKGIYINGHYNKIDGLITISIGKYQNRGANPCVNFVFKKK